MKLASQSDDTQRSQVEALVAKALAEEVGGISDPSVGQPKPLRAQAKRLFARHQRDAQTREFKTANAFLFSALVTWTFANLVPARLGPLDGDALSISLLSAAVFCVLQAVWAAAKMREHAKASLNAI